MDMFIFIIHAQCLKVGNYKILGNVFLNESVCKHIHGLFQLKVTKAII